MQKMAAAQSLPGAVPLKTMAILLLLLTSLVALPYKVSAAAGGWSEVEELCGDGELWLNSDTLEASPSIRPAVACDTAGDCIALYSSITDVDLEIVQLKYRTRPHDNKTWSEAHYAFNISKSADSSLPGRGQSMPKVSSFGDQGWAVAFRNQAPTYYGSKLKKTFQSIHVGQISKAKALEGGFWTGEEEGYGLQITAGTGYKRYPNIGTDDNGTAVIIWETPTTDGQDLGDDKDILSTSFSVNDGTSSYGLLDNTMSETSLMEVTSAYSGAESDLLQDRNPSLLSDQRTGRILLVNTITLANGHADIEFAEAKAGLERSCSWYDRVRVTNYGGKDADVHLASSPHNDTWMLIWQHESVGIRYARLTPGDNGALRVETTGFVHPVAFPYTLSDEEMFIIADPSQAGRWAVFYRWEVLGTSLFRLAFRVSEDDGNTWSSAYFADDGEVSKQQLFHFGLTTNSEGEIFLASVYRNLNDKTTGWWRISATTSDALFDVVNSATDMVEDIPYQDTDPAVSCFELVLYSNGTHTNVTDYFTLASSPVVQCIKLSTSVPNATIHLDLNISSNMEYFDEYLTSCPFNFLALRESDSLTSEDFGVDELNNTNVLGNMTRRVCAKGHYDGIELWSSEVYVFVSYEDKVQDDIDTLLPVDLTAWVSPIVDAEDEVSASDEPYEIMFVSTYEQLSSLLANDTFVHGEIRITANIDLVYELVIEQGKNISLIGDPSESDSDRILLQGDEFLHVHRGGTLWRYENFQHQRNTSIFDGEHRFGGQIFVQGTLGRIKNCYFYNAKAGGSLSQRFGGALLVDGTVNEILDSTYEKMSATTGGAVALTSRGQIGTISNCIFTGNTQNSIQAGEGGCMYVAGYIDTIIDTVFSDNQCEGGGGAITVVSGGQIRAFQNVDFTGNTAGLDGGAVEFKTNSILPEIWQGGSIKKNEASVGGGAIYISNALPSSDYSVCGEAQLCMIDVQFSGNSANMGAAIYAEESPSVSAMNITSCTFTSNEATKTSGGAIYATGAFVIDVTESTFTKNTATTVGGAVAVDSGAEINAVNATFDSNTAAQQGGAIYAGVGTIANMNSTVFVDNAASFTCREQTTCDLVTSFSTRAKCGAFILSSNSSMYQTAECQLNEVSQADASEGCTKGVGGSMYLAAAVTSHIHKCDFQADNPLPTVDESDIYVNYNGVTNYFADSAGRYIYAESRFRFSESTYAGASTSFAPSTSIIGCPDTCSSLGTCLTSSSSISVECTCTGAVEGDDGYEEGGCSRRRVRNVIGNSTFYTRDEEDEDDSSVADGYVVLTWTWTGDTDMFLIYRTDERDSTTMPSLSSCIDVSEAKANVPDCILVQDSTVRSAEIGLEVSTPAFFRVLASVSSVYTAVSDAMSSASIICEPGAERVPAAEDGSYECEYCPRGSYVEDATVGCIQCPNDLLTTRGKATSVDDCFAPAGYYSTTDENGDIVVYPCVTGMNCSSVGESLEVLDLLPGYWRASRDSASIYACEVAARCVGGDGSLKNTSSNSSNRRMLSAYTNPLYCAEGHTGPFCAACEDDLSYNDSGLCTECTDERRNLSIAKFSVMVIFTSIGWLLIIFAVFYYAQKSVKTRKADRCSCVPSFCRKRSKVARCKACCSCKFQAHVFEDMLITFMISLGFFQIAYGFHRIFEQSYDWLSVWDDYSKGMAWFNLDSSKLSSTFSCFIEDTQFSRVLFATIMPIVALLLLFISFLCFQKCLAWFEFEKEEQREDARGKVTAMTWRLAYYLIVNIFPQANLTIIQTFIYDTLEDGTQYLRYDYSTEYSTTSTLHYYSLVMSIIYSVGPVGLLSYLIYSRTPGVEALYEQHVDPERKTKDYSRFTYKFREYFQVLDMIRKYFQTSVALLVAEGTVGQLAFTYLITFAGTMVQMYLHPYRDYVDNFYASMVHAGLFLLLTVILWSTIEDSTYIPRALACGIIGYELFLLLWCGATKVSSILRTIWTCGHDVTNPSLFNGHRRHRRLSSDKVLKVDVEESSPFDTKENSVMLYDSTQSLHTSSLPHHMILQGEIDLSSNSDSFEDDEFRKGRSGFHETLNRSNASLLDLESLSTSGVVPTVASPPAPLLTHAMTPRSDISLELRSPSEQSMKRPNSENEDNAKTTEDDEKSAPTTSTTENSSFQTRFNNSTDVALS